MKKVKDEHGPRAKFLNDKGVASIFYVAIIVLVGLIVGEGVYLQNYIANVDFYKRSVRETAILESINTMEFIKKYMKEALQLSFYKASYDVLGSGYATGKTVGGFCCYDTKCDAREQCKIPLKIGKREIPTFKCKPWWRIYDDVYVPSLSLFIGYLENRTSKLYNTSMDKLDKAIDKASIPGYCPMPPGNVTVEELSNKVRLNASSAIGEPITYQDTYITITEPNAFFSDKFKVSTIELFKAAREEFAEDDWVEKQFDYADEGGDELPSMPNNWCSYVGDYCDMTAACSPTKPSCWGGDCCCKGMYFGDMCEEDLPDCEEKLEGNCTKDDKNRIDPCNFNRNAKSTVIDRKVVNANEKYNCTMLERLGTPELPKVTQVEGEEWFEIRTEVAKCVNVGHESEQLESSRIDVSWIEERDNPLQAQEKCQIIGPSGKDCNCKHQCFVGTTQENEVGWCGDCNGYSEGTFEDKCPASPVSPAGYEWTLNCPNDCCAEAWTCTQRVVGCTGTNTWDCDGGCPHDYPNNCCDYDHGCSCGGCDCAGVACGGDCSSSCCSLVAGSCVNLNTCPSCCAGSSANSRDPHCEGKNACESIGFAGDECFCGCTAVWEHTFSRSCRSQACGYSCCVQTYAYVKDVRCKYDYIGTANVSVDVRDIENKYPIGSDWWEFDIPFYVASGNTNKNALKCSAVRTDDKLDTPQIENPEWQYCKCKSITTPEPITAPPCPYSCLCSCGKDDLDNWKCGCPTEYTPESGYSCSNFGSGNCANEVSVCCRSTPPTPPTTTYTTTVYVHDYYLDRKILSALVRLYGSGFDETKNTLNRDYITFKTGYLANAQLSASKSGYENAPNPYQHPSSMSITVDGDKTYTLWLRGRSPTCSITSIKLNPYTPYSYTSGTTIWYNPVDSLYNVFAVNVYASSFETEPLLDSYWLLAVNFPNTVSAGESKYPPSYYFTTLTTSHTYSWDSGATYSGASTVTVYDVLSHRGTCDFTVTRDAEAPTTTASITGSNPYAITLTCTDNAGGAGCGNTLYCTDKYNMCTPLNTYTSPVSISCSGRCYVRYFSSDKVGNQESIKSVPFGSS